MKNLITAILLLLSTSTFATETFLKGNINYAITNPTTKSEVLVFMPSQLKYKGCIVIIKENKTVTMSCLSYGQIADVLEQLDTTGFKIR